MTTVVKCTPRHPNWTLYIGREWAGIPESKWQNPFRVDIYGLHHCLELYEQYIRDHVELMAVLYDTSNQEFGCWCHKHPSDGSKIICHGDILIKLRKEQLEGLH